jgi:hypothetical protein
VIDREPAGECAGHHDALDAEVEHAGTLAQQHAERAEHQRRRDAQHRHPEGHTEQQVERLGHPVPQRQRTRQRTPSVAISTAINATATITSAM